MYCSRKIDKKKNPLISIFYDKRVLIMRIIVPMTPSQKIKTVSCISILNANTFVRATNTIFSLITIVMKACTAISPPHMLQAMMLARTANGRALPDQKYVFIPARRIIRTISTVVLLLNLLCHAS